MKPVIHVNRRRSLGSVASPPGTTGGSPSHLRPSAGRTARFSALVVALLAALLWLKPARAAVNGINWWTTDSGGGASATSDGRLRLFGTIGQPDADARKGGTREVVGGFWPVRYVEETSPCTSTRTESEPNDTPATAHPLGTVSYSKVVGFLPMGDVDYYRFTTPPGARAWITVDTGGMQSRGASTRDSVVSLLAEDGTTVLETDDDDGTGNGGDATTESGLASAIAGRALPGGDVYIRVEGKHGVLSPYHLFLTVTTASMSPEAEPNDTPAIANRIVTRTAPIGVRSGSMAGRNDMDYYAVTVSGRSLLHVSATSEWPWETYNLIVDLITRDGMNVLFTADSSTVGQPGPPAEAFGFIVSTAGTYYVRVREAQGFSSTNYCLMVAACAMPELPTLGMVRVTPSAFSFSVPAGPAYGFTLETSADLTSWSDIPCDMTGVDDMLQLSVPITPNDLARFIRVRGMAAPPP